MGWGDSFKENLPSIAHSEDVETEFEKFWQGERSEALRKVAEDEHIDLEAFQTLIGEYIYSQKTPLGDDIVALLPEAPSILKRQSIIERIKGAIVDIVDIFEW